MSTFIRGVPGIIELITHDRDRLVVERGQAWTNKKIQILSIRIETLNGLLGTLKQATILPEAEFDAMVARFEPVKAAAVQDA